MASMDTWASCRIDEMAKSNPALVIPSVYMKRAAHNIIAKNKTQWEQQIDNVSLFLADDNGNIDTDTFFEDVKSMLSAMDAYPFDLGVIRGYIGEGSISIDIPDNIITTMLFGSKKSISITPDDIMELKDLLMA